MDPAFIHLRNHTPYSLAEGMLRIREEIAPACAEMGMPAVAITDTNNMFGVAAFCSYMRAGGIQPIIGTQISVDFGLPSGGTSKLVLLVKDEEGYKNLIKLASRIYVSREPGGDLRLPVGMLGEKSGGLIALTGGVDGVIGQCLLSGNGSMAGEKCALLKSIFGDRLYMEIQRHGLKSEIEAEDGFVELAYKHGVPLVATNECYFLKREMYRAHDILMCISEGKFHDDPARRKVTPEHYFKSAGEMAGLFRDMPEAVSNTVVIARRCAYCVAKSKPMLPHVSKDADEKMLLTVKARAGLEERMAKLGLDAAGRAAYLDRLAYEIGVILKMGFEGYFLIVADFINWAKSRGIPVGPGRGSGAGSIVAWSLNITDLDPLQFGLLFERFLNPDRVSMPDFDIDFCQDRRDEVIRYVQDKYGVDSVGQIITYGKLQSKAVIKDTGRVLRIPYAKCDDLARMIPFKLADEAGRAVETSIPNCIKYVQGFREMIEGDETYTALMSIAVQLEGLYKTAGLHAAGVVIGTRPLDEIVPLYKDDDSAIPATQFDMKYIEDTGLIKYDFLGLKTLTVIKTAVGMVRSVRGVEVDIGGVPLDDKPAFEMISSGNTAGIFQLESGGMQRVIRDLKPDRFEDLIALVALYRPGPMENIPVYIRRKFGEKVEYPHPLMEPILRETYGIMVYQEQVMEIARQLAGYTMGEADELRKIMGKKIKEKMAKQHDKFVGGCVERSGIDEGVANDIFDMMAKFASYGFNKSHAACYAWIAYQTAYLKANFFPEFMAATMTYDMGTTEKMAEYADNIKRQGVGLLRPDINRSFEYFSVEDGDVRFALAGIKGVGKGAVQGIVAERERGGDFKGVSDFIGRVGRSLVNKKMMEGMVKAGAFDSLDPNRAKLAKNIDYIVNEITARSNEEEAAQSNLFAVSGDFGRRDDIKLAECAPWRPMDALEAEREVIGFYVSSHPLDIFDGVIRSLHAAGTEEAKARRESGKIAVAGILEDVRDKVSKAGNPYRLVRVADKTGYVDVMFFDRRDRKAGIPMDALGSAVVVDADVKVGDDGRVSLFGNSVEKLGLDQALSGTLRIIVGGADAVVGIKKALDSIPPGYCGVELVVRDGGREAAIPLPGRLAITAETLDLFKSIGQVEVEF